MNEQSTLIYKWGPIFIGCLLAYQFLLVPWLVWVSDTKADISRLQGLIVKQESVIESEAQYQAFNQKLKDELGSFKHIKQLKESEDSAILWLNAIDEAVSKYDVEVENKDPGREVVLNDTYLVRSGKLSFSGDANQVLNLIHKLENIELGYRIRQVFINRKENTPQIAKANIEFLRIYKKNEK